ncbi:MAG: putative DNA-binding transcriptional regulator YafY, partial [Polyangiales bacterium]
ASERAEALAPEFRRRLVVRADGQEDPRHLQVLEQAFEEKRYVDARYYTAGRDAVSDRRIAPCGLLQVRGTWYVAAAEGKVFKVGRFERVELSEDHFDVAPVPLSELRHRLERMDFGGHKVHLKIDGEDRHIPSFTPHALRRYVRVHRGRAEVVTPLKGRQELIEETQAILDRYL